ncbi:MAG: leucine-rich repeat protein, partial [Flavobacteriales bacterium]|nr:leucine-rich repeat protein [Flavobacteriales bacterium]
MKIKNIALYISAILATACAKDNGSSYDNDPLAVKVNASIGAITKTTEGENGVTTWDENDVINVFSGNKSYTYKYSNGKWVPDGDFHKWTAESMEFAGSFPANSTLTTFRLPSNQADLDTYKNADYMVAAAASKTHTTGNAISLGFEHMLSKVTIKIVSYGDQYATTKPNIAGFVFSTATGDQATVYSATNEVAAYFTADESGAGLHTFSAVVLPGSVTSLGGIWVNGVRTSIPGSFTYEKGKHYTLKLNVGKNVVKVSSVEVSDWNKEDLIGGQASPLTFTNNANASDNSISTLSEQLIATFGTDYMTNGKIKKLAINGTVNQADLYNLGDIRSLTNLDLSGSTVVGSISLSDTENQEANAIPQKAFIYNSNFQIQNNITEFKFPQGITAIGSLAFSDVVLTGALVIPSTVKKIYERAFNNCRRLSSVTLPEGLEYIGNYAFYSCYLNGLDDTSTFTLPSTVTHIGDSAFASFKMNGSITIPATVQTIGNKAFYGATLKTVNIAINDNAVVGDSIFSHCTNLTTANVSGTTKTIPNGMFRQCTALKNVTIPSTVETIESLAFFYCSSLSGDLVIPASTKTIEEQAFMKCGYNTLTLPSGLETIGDAAFTLCNFTGDLVIPASVTYIGSNAFRMSGFTGSLTIFDGLKNINEATFDSCNFSGTLTLPSNLETIGVAAFYNCKFTGNLSIPASVTEIKQYAFKICDSLTGISVYWTDGNIPNDIADIVDVFFP